MDREIMILIVDDDMVERQAIKRALSKSGQPCNITEVDSVQSALELLKYNIFDVILLDYLLPGVNGIELLLEIKSSHTSRNAAVVMVSNYADDDLIIESLNAGAQDFLLKEDIKPSQLKRTILQSRKRQELEQQLYESYQKVKDLAERDSLTELYNRYFFEDALARKLVTTPTTPNERIAVMMMDLDKFKHINDTYGHDMGDKLLTNIAVRFKNVIKESALFARLGGDEFALAFDQMISLSEAHVIGRLLLRTLAEPFDIAGCQIRCSGSIGISFFPDNGDTVTDLMKYADIAMYRAKRRPEKSLCIFKDNMHDEVLQRYKVESELRNTSAEDDFSINYQPIMKNNDIVGVEALVRWTTASVPCGPDHFIPIAEETGIIQSLGKWVFDKSVKELGELFTKNGRTLYISINVSPYQLRDGDFPQFVEDCLAKHELHPERIVIEITETALLENDQMTTNALRALSQLGVRIALDDFGTGFSSVSHLLSYPIDIVKIDKSITQNLLSTTTKNRKMLEGLSVMLQSLDIDVIAEGIEGEDQAKVCEQFGIYMHQGYLYSKPIDLPDLKDKMK